MGNHNQQRDGRDNRDNHDNTNRVRPINPEVMPNESNTNGPSPSGMAMTLASSGRFPELRETFRRRMEATYERMSSAMEVAAQAAEAQAVLMDQYAAEETARYDEMVKLCRKNGS